MVRLTLSQRRIERHAMNAQFPTPETTRVKKPIDVKHAQEKTSKIEALLLLEAKVREVHTLAELQFLIANETRKLVQCRQILIHRSAPTKSTWRIEKVSSVAQADRNAPLLKWLHKEIKANLLKANELDAQAIKLVLENSNSQENYPFKKGIYLPLKDRDGFELGGISLLSEKSISQQDVAIATRLAATYAHAWAALKPVSKTGWYLLSKRNFIVVSLIILLLGMLPVPLTVLSPVEIVARDALVIAAPIEGVVEEVFVAPNTIVKKGDALFRYNALDFKNRYDLASRSMAVASARYQRASQSSFGGGDGRRELAITKAEYEVVKEEKSFAASQLALVEVKAQADGIILFTSKNDWVGRPVTIGERVMRLADAQKTEFKIKVPVSDSIILSEDATARIFLDSDPLNPMSAQIVRKSYAAEKQGDEPMAFPVTAKLKDNKRNQELRIGLRGMAQLSGRNVPLAFNLFRKPLSAIRQYLGL